MPDNRVTLDLEITGVTIVLTCWAAMLVGGIVGTAIAVMIAVLLGGF